MPEPVEIEPDRAEAQDPAERPYYETLEGMRVGLATGTANSGGTNKFGELFLTLGAEQDRVFRTEDPPVLIATVDDAGAGDPDNPYRPEQQSTTAVEADLFDRVDGAVGPLSFTFDNYKVVVQPGDLPTVADTGVVYPYSGVGPAASKQLRIASFNFENYFPVGGALDGGNVTQAEFDEKTARLTDAIDDLLERPDIVAVQEVYDLPTFQTLADSLGGYTAYLEEGNDARGIDVGFLVKDTVTVRGVTQYGKTATGPESFDCSDVPGGLFDRPPLALEIQAKGFGEFTIFSNHFASKAASDECRAAQAAFVRDRVAELEEAGKRSIVAGDLNAFEDESALATLEDGTTTLDNLWDRAPAEERYSFAFQGKLQTLDHVLLTRGLQSKVGDFRYAHFDNDYYEREDPTDGHKVSDHDPPVLTL
ncbi:MAG: endonuclease/exonuclease/phosphatase family protein, partial [Actinobacteria bacterium]|nr:endonuclease/exonuclease/phosphatase family protein [Actinomycetota bacterium]